MKVADIIMAGVAAYGAYKLGEFAVDKFLEMEAQDILDEIGNDFIDAGMSAASSCLEATTDVLESVVDNSFLDLANDPIL